MKAKSIILILFFSIALVSCKKDQMPTVITQIVSEITSTTATCGGDCTSDAGLRVALVGVCWKTSPNPTVTDKYTISGGGTGEFTSYMTQLQPNTTYYVRAYATNGYGTAYGNEEVFTTLPAGK